MSKRTTTAYNLPPMRQTPALDLAILGGIRDSLPPRPAMTGHLVLLEEGQLVTDPESGITYCTQKAWDALKSAIPLAKPPA
jgi:hypothetical protein